MCMVMLALSYYSVHCLVTETVIYFGLVLGCLGHVTLKMYEEAV